MRRVGFLGLVVALIAAVLLPTTAYAAGSSDQPGATDVLIARKAAFRDGGCEQGVSSRFVAQQFADITGRLGVLPEGGKRYAVVIGSNYVGSVSPGGEITFVPPFEFELGYAEADAEAMAGLLMGYGFDTVIPLVGDGAGRIAILNAVEQLRDSVRPGDEVVFFYSGHGASYMDTGRGRGYGWGWPGTAKEGIVTDEGDGNAVDFLWDYQLAREFDRFRTNRIVFMFDCCLAGGMTELAKHGRIVCMATTKTGIAAEVGTIEIPNPDGTFTTMEINHGLFTFFLLGALSGLIPEADAYDHVPGMPDVTVEEAYDFASYSLVGMTPLIQGGIEQYYGPDIAASWGTPTVVDLFCKDLLL